MERTKQKEKEQGKVEEEKGEDGPDYNPKELERIERVLRRDGLW